MLSVSSNISNIANTSKSLSSLSFKGVNQTPPLQSDEFVKEGDDKDKKMSKGKLAAIIGGVVAFGGIIAAAILCKGKTLQPANFAEHIDYVKANTMEEAIEFAKKHFGIKKFDLGDDLEMANWVNQGLTNINNRFKGKANMPENIVWDGSYFKEHPNALAYCSGHKTIAFNKEAFSNSKIGKVKELLKSIFPDGEEAETFKIVMIHGEDAGIKEQLFNSYMKMLDNPDQYTRFDAIHTNFLIDDYVASIKFSEKHPEYWLKKAGEDSNISKILSDNGVDISVENFNKLDKTQKEEHMKKFFEIAYTNGFKSAGHATCRGNSLFDVLYHEMGHLLHNMNTSLKDQFWGVLSKKSKNQFIDDIAKQEIASNVSWYAQTNPNEFVAECFNAMCAGKKLPKEVMDQYKFYKGPMLPEME